MASPPHHSPATSPPYPPHIPLPNPKKRPSLSVGGPSKRQKRTSIHSAVSSNHPLRQTSFPPEETAIEGARSPSVESDFTAVTGGRSVVTAGTTKRGRGKGKKRKADASVRSGGKAKTVDGARAESELPEDDEEEDEGGGMVDDGKIVDVAAEKERIGVLVHNLNSDQLERFKGFRASKLKHPVVRKITNQTVSQSVPPGVILTINAYTKMFIGTLIERARVVQSQWAALETPPFTPPEIPIDPTDFHMQASNNNPFAAESGGSALADLTIAAHGTEEQQPPNVPTSKDLGPLLPDHFREALRRYKRDGESGGTGLAGVSVGLGLQGAGSARLGGRRLFR